MKDISYDWFARYTARLSRQRLATMAKRVGLEPFRRQGEWQFRTAGGNELTVKQAFDLLQENARGREWLRFEYEYPKRSAEEALRLERAREERLTADIRSAFDFLITDFGYSPPFRVPVRISDRLILAYRNNDAARQVEVSGHPGDVWTHCEIRRLFDGEAGSYGQHSIGDWELNMAREDALFPHLFERAERLRTSASLLQRHGDILRGESWIERTTIDQAIDRVLFQPSGLPAPGPDDLDRLDIAKQLAHFLIEQHGFALEFDSSTLSPHETQMWKTLLYRRGNTTVDISNTDIRLPDEWAVRLNNEVIAREWTNFELGLARALDEVARRISSV